LSATKQAELVNASDQDAELPGADRGGVAAENGDVNVHH
jgi:hypothetical protein